MKNRYSKKEKNELSDIEKQKKYRFVDYSGTKGIQPKWTSKKFIRLVQFTISEMKQTKF
jgi:hypothetical protein